MKSLGQGLGWQPQRPPFPLAKRTKKQSGSEASPDDAARPNKPLTAQTLLPFCPLYSSRRF